MEVCSCAEGTEWCVVMVDWGEPGDMPQYRLLAEGFAESSVAASGLALEVAAAIRRAAGIEPAESWCSFSDLLRADKNFLWGAAHPAPSTELPCECACGATVTPRSTVCQSCGRVFRDAFTVVLVS